MRIGAASRLKSGGGCCGVGGGVGVAPAVVAVHLDGGGHEHTWQHVWAQAYESFRHHGGPRASLDHERRLQPGICNLSTSTGKHSCLDLDGLPRCKRLPPGLIHPAHPHATPGQHPIALWVMVAGAAHRQEQPDQRRIQPANPHPHINTTLGVLRTARGLRYGIQEQHSSSSPRQLTHTHTRNVLGPLSLPTARGCRGRRTRWGSGA